MGIVDNFKKLFKRKNAERYLDVVASPYGKGDNLNRAIPPKDIAKEYKSWVYVFVRLIANKMMMNEFNVLFKGAKKEYEINDGPINDLFNNPNPIMDTTELWERTVIDLQLHGNAYWYVVRNRNGKPIELHPLMGHLMRVVPETTQDGNGELVAGYVYEIGNTESHYHQSLPEGKKSVAFSREEVIHFKLPGPRSIYYGFSPLEASAYAIDLDNQTNEHRLKLLKNRAIPDGLLVSKLPLDENEARALRNKWQQLYSGGDKRGKIAVIEHGALEFVPLNIPLDEIEHIESREQIREEIAAAFGVPVTVVLAGQSSNKSELEASERMMNNNVIMPLLKKLEGTINKYLMPMFKGSHSIKFQDPRAKDSQFRLEQLRTYYAFGHATRNELRKIDGLPPIEGGDEIMAPMNLGPLSNILEGDFGQGNGPKPGDANSAPNAMEGERGPARNEDKSKKKSPYQTLSLREKMSIALRKQKGS